MTRTPTACVVSGATALTLACSGPGEPGDGPAPGTLAFVRDSAIYIVATEGSPSPSLLDTLFTKPSWSPDGSTLAMVASASATVGAVYLADAEGGNVRELTLFASSIRSTPLWSSDGMSLLVRRLGGNEFDPDEVSNALLAGGAETPITTVDRYATLSLSAEGSLLTIAGPFTFGFTVVAVPSGDTTLSMSGQSPLFSPVTEDIAYGKGFPPQLHLIRPDGTDDRELSQAGTPLSWAPDGERLAFRGIDGAVYTAGLDGSGLSRIGPLNTTVRELVWSSDGEQVAFITTTSSGPQTIYLSRTDGSEARPLVTADSLCCLAWRPQ
jgi:Tol biopolymer transport system component